MRTAGIGYLRGTSRHPYAPTVRFRDWLRLSVVVLGLLLVSCSSDGQTAAAADSAANSEPLEGRDAVASICEADAQRVVDRLLAFTSDLGDVGPQEFLADGDIDGLREFQNDVGQIISESTNQNSTLCDLNGLQQFVDAKLAELDATNLITSYLVSTIRFGGNIETADIAVEPGDDLVAILALLDDGSSITFGPGTYVLDSPLLVGRDISLIGAGRETTILESTAADAAIAVFGDGALRLRDLDVSHSGDRPASVILAFGAPVDIERVNVRGARGDAEQGGTGNGVLLSAGIIPGPDGAADTTVGSGEVKDSVLVDVQVSNNEVAGIAVNDRLAPVIENARILDNELCGICFLGESAGIVEASTIEGNAFGVQAGDRSAPIVRNNTIRSNGVVGVVIVGESGALIESNIIEDNGEAAIAVQESASPQIMTNTIGTQPFGITLVGTSTATVTNNVVTGADVGVQAADMATPVIRGNELVSIEIAGIVNRDSSAADVVDNTITGNQSVGVLVEGESSPTISGLSVDGGNVGASYRESGGGSLEQSSFASQEIGIQIEDDAVPTISSNSFDGHSAAAIVVRSDGEAKILNNEITSPDTLGVGVAGASSARLEGNTVTGGETAVSLIESSRARLVDNTLTGQLVSVQVADESQPVLEGNRILSATGVGIVYRDASGGEFRDNTIVDPGTVGVQLIDDSAPSITGNAILLGVIDGADPTEGSAEDGDPADKPQLVDETAGQGEATITVAILISGSSRATVSSNELYGFIVGVQVEATARPDVTDNIIDGGAAQGVGVLHRDEAAGTASGNRTRLHAIGFQVDDRASPALIDNTIEWASDVAILVQGSSTPRIEGNVCPTGVAGLGVRAPAAPELGINSCELVAAES